MQYTLIAGLIQFVLYLQQIPEFAIGKTSLHHNSTSSMIYNWCDTGVAALPPIPSWAKNFELWFVYCPIFVRLGRVGYFDIVWLPQQWFLDSNICHTSQLHVVLLLTMDIDTFFPDIGSVVQWYLEKSALSHELVTLMKLSSAFIVAFGLTSPNLWFCFVVSWCPLTEQSLWSFRNFYLLY